jgi:hypothetical protein
VPAAAVRRGGRHRRRRDTSDGAAGGDSRSGALCLHASPPARLQAQSATPAGDEERGAAAANDDAGQKPQGRGPSKGDGRGLGGRDDGRRDDGRKQQFSHGDSQVRRWSQACRGCLRRR